MSVTTLFHARNSARLWLRNAVFSFLAVAGIGAAIWLAGGYIRVFPTFFAPQQLLEAIFRDFLQNDNANCVLPNRRRCASGQEVDSDPPYAPFEKAARKVMRHAGF